MTEKERKSCIGTVETLRRLAFNVHGVMDVIDKQNCDKIISALSVPEREKGEWIPVSERLPDEEHEVYCQLSDGSNAVLYVQDNWGQMDWVDGMMGTGTYDVVAWREKPEPYKAEGASE